MGIVYSINYYWWKIKCGSHIMIIIIITFGLGNEMTAMLNPK